MSNHLGIAREFTKQKLQERDDIVGVLLVGSAARGDTTAFSDVDLRIIVDNSDAGWLSRDGLDCWIDGTYVDAGLVQKDAYATIDRVLENPTVACDLNDAIILHDTAGFLRRIQNDVQATFMQPRWVGSRVKPHVDKLPVHIDALQTAMAANDPLNLCIQAGRIMYRLALIPLFVHGISPSSTRMLIQLEQVSKPLTQRLYELEDTVDLSLDVAKAAVAILARLTEISGADKRGELPGYMVKKAGWMTQNGMTQAALHTAWINCGFRIKDSLATEDSQVIIESTILTEEWLSLMHWKGEDAIHKKLDMIHKLRDEIMELSSKYVVAVSKNRVNLSNEQSYL